MDMFWSDVKDAVSKYSNLSHTEIDRMDVMKFFIKLESMNNKNKEKNG